MTVLLADDHAVVREGYRRLLEESGRIRLTLAEIADPLGVAAKTLATHQAAIKQKLGAEIGRDLVRHAIHRGLVPTV